MLRGAIVIDRGRKRKPLEEYSGQAREDRRGFGISKKLKSGKPTDSPCTSRDDTAVGQATASAGGRTRDSWMMGDLGSLFEVNATESRTSKIDDLYTRKSGHLITEQRPLEPGLHSTGRGSSDDDATVGPNPLPPTAPPRRLPHRDITVGDGGRGWREKAARRRAQQLREPKQPPAENLDRVLSSYGTQKQESLQQPRVCRTNLGEHTKMQLCDHEDNKVMTKMINEKSFDFKHRTKRHERQELQQSVSAEKVGEPRLPEQPVNEERDLNFLASQALKCLMAGDRINYEKLEAKKSELMIESCKDTGASPLVTASRKKESAEEIRVLEDVDGRGRYLPLLQSKRNESAIGNREPQKRLQSSEDPKEQPQRRHPCVDDKSLSSVDAMYRTARLDRETEDETQRQLEYYVMRKVRKSHKHDCDEDEGDDFRSWEEKKTKKKSEASVLKRERQERIADTKHLHAMLDSCLFCPESRKFSSVRKTSMIAMSPRAYVCFQSFRQCVVQCHLFIAPISHSSNSVYIDEDVYQDVRNFQKSLVRFFDQRDMAAIFVECFNRVVSIEKSFLGAGGHMTIDCFGVAIDRLDEAKASFKTTLSQIGSHWSQHKKIIDVPIERRQGIRGVVPKNFPFFHVDFNLGGGMAHIIEDKDFPLSLGREVIQGMMELERHQTYYSDHQEYQASVAQFKKEFACYDWTAKH